MLARINADAQELEPSSAEGLADTLFEIGNSQVTESKWSDAIPWLEKAHDILAGQNLEVLSSDAGELQISVMHSMARALINQQDQDSRTKAWSIIRKLEIECGDRLVVLLLKLEGLAFDGDASVQDYCDVLQRIVRTVHLTETNIKTIIHHVYELRPRSPPMAHTVLNTLLMERLLGAEEQKWVEKVLVTIVWNYTTSTDFMNTLGPLTELFNTLEASSTSILSPSATHAAQIVRTKLRELDHPLTITSAFMEAHRNQLQPGRIRGCRRVVSALLASYIWQFWDNKYW